MTPEEELHKTVWQILAEIKQEQLATPDDEYIIIDTEADTGVLTFSIYSFIKPSWAKFAALLAVILLEAGFLFYSLMGAIY